MQSSLGDREDVAEKTTIRGDLGAELSWTRCRGCKGPEEGLSVVKEHQRGPCSRTEGHRAEL